MTLPKLALSALLLAMAGTLAPAGSVQAQDVSAETRLKTWDPDNDGTIDMAEVKKAASAQFDRLDGDRDGTLDMNELLPKSTRTPLPRLILTKMAPSPKTNILASSKRASSRRTQTMTGRCHSRN
jgi:hypothetical protein